MMIWLGCQINAVLLIDSNFLIQIWKSGQASQYWSLKKVIVKNYNRKLMIGK
jgi:hypothetical protein